MWKLYENSMKTEYCYAVRNRPFWRTGKYAFICDMPSIKALISEDYTHTGKCNYYTTDDEMHHYSGGMAFQVLKVMQPIQYSACQCSMLHFVWCG